MPTIAKHGRIPRVVFILFFLSFSLLAAGCKSSPEETIIGTWKHSQSGAPLKFFPDGSGFFYQLPMEWSISGHSIRLKVGNADAAGTYALTGDTLNVYGFSYMHELNGRYQRTEG